MKEDRPIEATKAELKATWTDQKAARATGNDAKIAEAARARVRVLRRGGLLQVTDEVCGGYRR